MVRITHVLFFVYWEQLPIHLYSQNRSRGPSSLFLTSHSLSFCPLVFLSFSFFVPFLDIARSGNKLSEQAFCCVDSLAFAIRHCNVLIIELGDHNHVQR